LSEASFNLYCRLYNVITEQENEDEVWETSKYLKRVREVMEMLEKSMMRETTVFKYRF